jgi:hypothetical protein
MVFLCIQIAIDQMQLCSLSVAYACPYHNLTTTMGHSVHNVDISKLLTDITFTFTFKSFSRRMTPYTWSAVVRSIGRTAKFFKTMLKVFGREINIKVSGNSSGRHCCQHAKYTLPQLETSVAFCCVTKWHIL